MQVIHDLCVVARAACPVTEAERDFLVGLAKDLALDPTFVEQTLDCSMDLD